MEWPLQLIAKLYSNFNNFFIAYKKVSLLKFPLHTAFAQCTTLSNSQHRTCYRHYTWYLVSTIFPLMTSFAEIWKYAPLRFRSVDSGDEKSSAISTYSPGNMHIQTHIRLCTCCTSVHAYCTYCKIVYMVHTYIHYIHTYSR